MFKLKLNPSVLSCTGPIPEVTVKSTYKFYYVDLTNIFIFFLKHILTFPDRISDPLNHPNVSYKIFRKKTPLLQESLQIWYVSIFIIFFLLLYLICSQASLLKNGKTNLEIIINVDVTVRLIN